MNCLYICGGIIIKQINIMGWFIIPWLIVIGIIVCWIDPWNILWCALIIAVQICFQGVTWQDVGWFLKSPKRYRAVKKWKQEKFDKELEQWEHDAKTLTQEEWDAKYGDED